jgi:hypothetical protein
MTPYKDIGNYLKRNRRHVQGVDPGDFLDDLHIRDNRHIQILVLRINGG